MRRTVALVLSALVFGANDALAVDWGGFAPPQLAFPSFGGVPDCAASGVVYDVVDRFGYVNRVQWHTGFTINHLDRIRETGYLPPTANTIARRWCEAVAWLSNGQTPTVYYVIEADRNFAGLGSRISYCLPGYDYWHVYGEACRTVKAGAG